MKLTTEFPKYKFFPNIYIGQTYISFKIDIDKYTYK